MAMEDDSLVWSYQVWAGPIFSLRIQAREDQLEVATVCRRVSPRDPPGQQQPPEPRPARQPQEQGGKHRIEGGQANEHPLIQRTALARSLVDRGEHNRKTVHARGVLLRHRIEYLRKPRYCLLPSGMARSARPSAAVQ